MKGKKALLSVLLCLGLGASVFGVGGCSDNGKGDSLSSSSSQSSSSSVSESSSVSTESGFSDSADSSFAESLENSSSLSTENSSSGDITPDDSTENSSSNESASGDTSVDGEDSESDSSDTTEESESVDSDSSDTTEESESVDSGSNDTTEESESVDSGSSDTIESCTPDENSSNDDSTPDDSTENDTTEDETGTEGVVYEIPDGADYAVVVGYNGSETEVEIASTYQGKPVTSIGEKAFYGCSSLTSIKIPDGVTSIEYGAFSSCGSLTSIEIPDSITNIAENAFWLYILKYNEYDNAYYLGNEQNPFVVLVKVKSENIDSCTVHSDTKIIFAFAFSGCKKLTCVEIPDGVTTIGRRAFSDCNSLMSVVIGNGVTSIGMDAFKNCSSLTGVYINDIAAWCNIDFTDSASNPLDYANNLYVNSELVKELRIPDGVTSIGEYAFYNCSGLTSIKIPDGVTSIGEYAFYNCSSLTSITIPDSVTSIGGSAFDNCNNLQYNEYDNAYYLGNEINPYTVLVKGKNNITSCEIHPDTIVIYSSAFSHNGLTSIEIPDCVKSIGSGAFSSVSALMSVVIGDGVTSIGDGAFMGCRKLESVVIGDGVISIGSSAFNECDNLSSVQIGQSLKSIGSLAFEGCDNIQKVYITDIAAWCNIDFENSNPLSGADLYVNNVRTTCLIIPDGVTTIGDNAFYECGSLTSVIIPDSVTSVGSYAFAGCSRLTSIKIGSGVSDIHTAALRSCLALRNIDVSEHNPTYESIEGSLYNKETRELVQYAIGKSAVSFTIPDGITKIAEGAFCYSQNLKTVVIGDEVVNIERDAFVRCINLIDVTIGEGVTSIGAYAFFNCDSLTSVTIGSGLKSIDPYAFSGCDSLMDVYIHDIAAWCNIDFAGETVNSNPLDYAHNFYVNNELLTDLKIPESVTRIGGDAFSNCSSLTKVEISDSVTSIGGSAFSGCSNLTKVVMGNGITSIGARAFYNCSSLSGVYISDIANWCNIKFDYKEANPLYYAGNLYVGGELLTELIIPEEVTSIDTYAFVNCDSLSLLKIHADVEEIGTFAGCDGLKYVEISHNAGGVRWVAYPFSNCNNIEEVVLPNYNSHFYGFFGKDRSFVPTGLEKVIITSGSIIGENYFLGLNGLKSIEIPDGVTSIGESAFSDCSGLTSIKIPDSVTSIGKDAFNNCNDLQYNEYDNAYYLGDEENPYTVLVKGKNNIDSCKIHSDTIVIYSRAFSNNGLTSIEIPGNVKSIGDSAFSYCTSLTSTTISDSVTSIGGRAFYNCIGLTSIVIGNGVTDIGAYAFYNCCELTSVEIPDSVTSIGGWAFYYCDSLTSVYYKGTAEDWLAITVDSANKWLTNATRYYYSESEPALNSDGTAYDGDYWHYDTDGITPVVWIYTKAEE